LCNAEKKETDEDGRNALGRQIDQLKSELEVSGHAYAEIGKHKEVPPFAGFVS